MFSILHSRYTICVIKYPGSKQNIGNLIQIHGNWLDRNIPQYSLIICPLDLALYNSVITL
jgi:hypothetical protein